MVNHLEYGLHDVIIVFNGRLDGDHELPDQTPGPLANAGNYLIIGKFGKVRVYCYVKELSLVFQWPLAGE